MSYNKIIEELIAENEQLKQDLLRTEELQDEIIQLEDEKRYWLDNFKRLRDDKVNLIDENTQLKKEIDDFYYEQSKLKESDFYIKALKNQLFNAYLEIESDNVNIELSHYHIKKLLKIIDEHTLINPYTN